MTVQEEVYSVLKLKPGSKRRRIACGIMGFEPDSVLVTWIHSFSIHLLILDNLNEECAMVYKIYSVFIM